MARLNDLTESDDEFPELSTLLRLGGADIKRSGRTSDKDHNSDVSPKSKEDTKCKDRASVRPLATDAPRSVTKASCDEKRSKRQRPLEPLKFAMGNSQRLPVTNGLPSSTGSLARRNEDSTNIDSVRSSPRRKAKVPVNYSIFTPALADSGSSISDGEESFTDLSGFIVPDSASEEESLPPRCPEKDVRRVRKKPIFPLGDSSPSAAENSRSINLPQADIIDLTSPKKRVSRVVRPESPLSQRARSRNSDRTGYHSDLEDRFTKLRFSPPRSKSPYKSKDFSRPVTPPSSPSKPKLQSPSKTHRIPSSPHRPSIDAFWSSDVINDWNEQYSPKKTLKSPSKFRLYSVDEDDNELSPSESPRRSSSKSPAKKDKRAAERLKAFNEKKHALATSFLADLDQTIARGQVAALAESSGGIKIFWSKKLSSTAGRANWKRETLRSKGADGVVSATTHRHHASIELAEKVIDDEDRLINVIAHEYCHLANFMITGIKDNPHGKEFKEWAKKCTTAFSHRNITVTTKHTYTIAYKYIWACTSPTCGLEYKRHSKSIDPAKHSCGSCKAKLIQVQPAPRKGAEGKRSEYQDYVKNEYERVRGENAEAGFGEMMTILGREFREKKEQKIASGNEKASTQGSIVEQEDEREDMDDGGYIDSVARKLDFLNLGS